MDYIYSTADPKIEPIYYLIAVLIALLMGAFLILRCRQGRMTKGGALASLLLTEYV